MRSLTLYVFSLLFQMKYKFTERRSHFFIAFTLIVIILAIVKCVNPDMGQNQTSCTNRLKENKQEKTEKALPDDSVTLHAKEVDKKLLRARPKLTLTKADGTPVKNRVTSVRRFEDSFPDLNDVQPGYG